MAFHVARLWKSGMLKWSHSLCKCSVSLKKLLDSSSGSPFSHAALSPGSGQRPA